MLLSITTALPLPQLILAAVVLGIIGLIGSRVVGTRIKPERKDPVEALRIVADEWVELPNVKRREFVDALLNVLDATESGKR